MHKAHWFSFDWYFFSAKPKWLPLCLIRNLTIELHFGNDWRTVSVSTSLSRFGIWNFEVSFLWMFYLNLVTARERLKANISRKLKSFWGEPLSLSENEACSNMKWKEQTLLHERWLKNLVHIPSFNVFTFSMFFSLFGNFVETNIISENQLYKYFFLTFGQLKQKKKLIHNYFFPN